jgi:hypothetical protein
MAIVELSLGKFVTGSNQKPLSVHEKLGDSRQAISHLARRINMRSVRRFVKRVTPYIVPAF